MRTMSITLENWGTIFRVYSYQVLATSNNGNTKIFKEFFDFHHFPLFPWKCCFLTLPWANFFSRWDLCLKLWGFQEPCSDFVYLKFQLHLITLTQKIFREILNFHYFQKRERKSQDWHKLIFFPDEILCPKL